MVKSRLIVVAVAAVALASSVFGAPEDTTDLGAKTFVQSCIRCHAGILTGNDLQNTRLGTVESLDEKVRRMQQYSGPLPEEKIKALVELLRDEDVNFRLEEVKLEQVEARAPVGEDAAAAPPDVYAELFVRSCAGCHTLGGGQSTGGDLTHTASYAVDRLKSDVARMQARVGPLTQEQIDGLTALLKDQEVAKRLAGAGYQPQQNASAASSPSPGQQTTGTGTQSASTGTQAVPSFHTPMLAATAPTKIQYFKPGETPKPAAPEPATHSPEGPPLLPVAISCILAALGGAFVFKLSSWL